ncbi:hypothetical protein RFI_09139, partial [Reticulomyxa filosa]
TNEKEVNKDEGQKEEKQLDNESKNDSQTITTATTSKVDANEEESEMKKSNDVSAVGNKKTQAVNIRWDEQNLQENEIIKESIPKGEINEPKTPFLNKPSELMEIDQFDLNDSEIVLLDENMTTHSLENNNSQSINHDNPLVKLEQQQLSLMFTLCVMSFCFIKKRFFFFFFFVLAFFFWK